MAEGADEEEIQFLRTVSDADVFFWCSVLLLTIFVVNAKQYSFLDVIKGHMFQ